MITILFLSANPDQTDTLKLTREFTLIRSKIDEKNFTVKPEFDISVIDLREKILKSNPQIIHFAGHGSPRSALVFTNNKDEIEIVPPESLSKLFSLLEKDIFLVFLNACFTEEQAKAISQHIKVVIGMGDEISDIAAREFAASFYSSVSFGRNIKNAFELAKTDLDFSSIPESSIPKLLCKDGYDPNNIFFKNGKIIINNQPFYENDSSQNISICEKINVFQEKYDDFLHDKIDPHEFFNIISQPIFALDRNSETGKLISADQIQLLKMQVLSLQERIKSYDKSVAIDDSNATTSDLKHAKLVANKIVNDLIKICNK